MMATSTGPIMTGHEAPALVGSDEVREAAAAIASERGEPAWLADARKEAAAAWADAPLPDRVAHLWRYTDPRDLLPDPAAIAPGPDGPGPYR